MLKTPLLQAPGQVNPQSPPIPDRAALPYLFPGTPGWIVDWGFVLVVLATVFTAWLLGRSSLGLRLRAVGQNPDAALVAGMNVKSVLFLSMLIAGALAGLAAFTLLFSAKDHPQGISPTFDAARVGFDAITVALLGRSRPWGVFAAGLLFGALRAGSFDMQAYVPIDLVSVIQSVIVLLIAAPPLVRTMFRLPKPSGFRLRRPSITKAVISR
ncbi:MAG: ABC transporter permease [Micrococcales bacterium]|nr:ABC transporter permease [Micrococcales bacterium]